MTFRVAVVLAGDLVDLGWLRAWLASAQLIYAADGGGDLVLRAGFKPDFLTGDFDSVSFEGLANAKSVVKVEDQDYSDCDKVLSLLSSHGITEALLLGSQGNRIDHMIGALHSICRWQGRASLAYPRQMAAILRGPDSIEIASPGTLSALPLSDCAGVRMSNVKWPVENREMTISGFSSLSNHSLGDASISLDRGLIAVFKESDGRPDWSWAARKA